jgi:phytoene dehydrogenase-like protein
LFDKWYILRLRNELRHLSLEEIFRRPERPTMEALHDLGFSDAMIQRFFQPVLGGIFFDYDLTTSSRMFEFVYKMFSFGETAVPAQGMEAIPRQMASQLPAESIRLNTQVTSVSPGKVRLASGEELEAKAIVLATEGTHLTELVEGEFEDFEIPESQSVTCLYFGADTSPVDKGILVLNGEGAGPVNNLVVMSQVAAGYAPAGKSLISITVLGNPAEDDEQLEQAVRAQLGDWYGGQVQQWQHLRTYRIPHGLPNQRWGKLEPPSRPVKLKDGLFVCGDHRETASLQGAMVSGRKAAEAVLLELARA